MALTDEKAAVLESDLIEARDKFRDLQKDIRAKDAAIADLNKALGAKSKKITEYDEMKKSKESAEAQVTALTTANTRLGKSLNECDIEANAGKDVVRALKVLGLK